MARPLGRPTDYTSKLAAEICELLSSGLSLRKVAQRDEMPNRDTIHTWLVTHKDFSDQYARACQVRRDNKFDQIEEIAETETDVQRARLRVDVIKWQLSKEEPKKYGDKLDLTSDGEKIEMPQVYLPKRSE